MKFKTTPYHFDLIKDTDRLASFWQAINDYNSENDLALDLGCGSGILSYFLSSNFKNIISVEIDKKAFNCAKDNLAEFSNIEVINSDVLDFSTGKKADLIVCEMLDTALIDEEEIPVLNYAKQFLKSDGEIIPKGIVNMAQLVNMQRPYLHWDEDAVYKTMSCDVNYSQLNFKDEINPEVNADITFKIINDGIINGLKITTVTKLNDNVVCGPTPMFNPPLLIPLDEKQVKCNDLISVKLKYIMGNGIESIKTNYIAGG